MNRLPNEILKEIFTLILPRQKVECMCVCRSWEKVMKDGCLFHTVLTTTRGNLDKYIRVFEDTPSNRAQVKKLILYISHQYSGLVKYFLVLFPNLEFFYYYGRSKNYLNRISSSWKDDRLNDLKTKLFVGIPHHLLTSNISLHLKVLDLNLSQSSITSLSPSLMNAPNLKHLTLKGYHFTYSEVEKFDDSFPLLKIVKFCIAASIYTKLPEDIKPNSRITCAHFRLRNTSMSDQSVLLRYISKKYTNLASFTYDSGVSESTIPLTHEASTSIALKDTLLSTILCQGPQLNTLKVLCARLDFSLLVNPIVPFQLETCKLDFTRTSPEQTLLKNTFSASVFCRLSVLTIQSLSTNDFKWLEALDKLKVLKIKHPQFTCLALDSVMQHISHTVETLVIKDCTVEVGQDYQTLEEPNIDQGDVSDCSNHIHPLKKLKLSYIRIKKNVDHFISHVCPGLESLSIYTCSTYHHEFRLPNIHLLYFNIAKERPMYIKDKDKCCDYIWIHTKEGSCQWRIEHSQHNHHGLKYRELYGFPAVPCPTPISNDALDGINTWHFTFASVTHIGAT